MDIQTFNPVEGVASAQGLDVSNFQGNYNWDAAKRAVPNLAFGVFRLTEGLPSSGDNSPDPFAAHNRHAISAEGLVQGAYHFLHPSMSGRTQARYFVDEYDKLGLFDADMLWVDCEVSDGLSPAAVAACGQDFMAELKVLKPDNPKGVYSFIDFADSGNCAGLGQYPLWLAHPASTAPTAPPPWHRWSFWQWGTRAGTDADAFNGTVADFHNWLTSFKPRATGPFKHTADGKQTLDEIARSRSMKPDSWLNLQRKLGADVGALAAGPVPAGAEWLSEGP